MRAAGGARGAAAMRGHGHAKRRVVRRARKQKPVEKTETELAFADHEITSGVGWDMLARMGHVRGTPLGAAGGRSEPVAIVVKTGRGGLGLPVVRSAPEAWGRAVEEVAAEVEALSFSRDPLRPRCRFNHAHVVADMKALQAHERRCPQRDGSAFGHAKVERELVFEESEEESEESGENMLSDISSDEVDEVQKEEDDDDDDDDLAVHFGGGGFHLLS